MWMVLMVVGARASEPVPAVTVETWRPSMSRDPFDPLNPYIVDPDQGRMVAVQGGRPLHQLEFAALIGDPRRSDIAQVERRDRAFTRTSLALTGVSLGLTLTGLLTTDLSVAAPRYGAALGFAVGGLALALPPAIPGRRVKALRYSADEARTAIDARFGP